MNVNGLLHDALTLSTWVLSGGDTFMVVDTNRIGQGGGGVKNPKQGVPVDGKTGPAPKNRAKTVTRSKKK